MFSSSLDHANVTILLLENAKTYSNVIRDLKIFYQMNDCFEKHQNFDKVKPDELQQLLKVYFLAKCNVLW